MEREQRGVIGYGVSVGNDENVLEIDGGHDCSNL